jgi:hypothetical protein
MEITFDGIMGIFGSGVIRKMIGLVFPNKRQRLETELLRIGPFRVGMPMFGGVR